MIGRFFGILEPTGTWAIWDEEASFPATVQGRCLIGLDQRQSERFLRQLEGSVPVGLRPVVDLESVARARKSARPH